MLHIAVNIREFRRRKGLTQESLANDLGVSSQTISRWETGITYPDIGMLPIIAHYFDTSIDHLMGCANECTPEERNAFLEEMKHLEGEKKMLRHREMLQQYPDDIYIQFSLANLLYKKIKKKNDLITEQEIRLLCSRILHSNQSALHCGAMRLLALLSAKNGDKNAALKYVNALPSIHCSREILALQIQHDIPFRKALAEYWAESAD